MTIAYFDCFSGISGDMTLGALVDAGAPFDELKAALAALPVGGYSITCRPVLRCGIGGSQVQVRRDEGAGGTDGLPDHSQGHHHGEHGHHGDHVVHEHHHDHTSTSHDPEAHGASGHAHEHKHTHDHEHGHGHHHHGDDEPHYHHHHHHHQPHRGFHDIRKIIGESGFSAWVKERAIEAFHRIAVEEAAVHQVPVDEVHFHEVGAVDAIVDIVGSMWCLERLGVTRVLASPVAVGSGTIRVAHGEMPIPAPATARLLRGKPICTGPVPGELTTPTGAAILAAVAESFGPLQDFAIEKIGYGAGMREYANHTNYLRVLLGEMVLDGSAGSGAGRGLPVQTDELILLTAEIDDMPGEMFGHVLERLLDAGALDCHFVPVQMKKNRPGISLNVLAGPADLDRLLPIIFKETSTFGLKALPCSRYSLRRRHETVETPFGPVRVKLGLWGDEVLKASPEYEDCRALAVKHGRPLSEIYGAAVSASASLTRS